MCVGILGVELFIPESGSLKSKRRVLKCLKDRIKAHFNASVSEVDKHDKWQRALIGIACIGKDKQYVNGTLSRISDFIYAFHQIEVIDIKMEIW